jgi:hypothetical protein
MIEKLGAFIFLIVFMGAFAVIGGHFVTDYASTTVTIAGVPTPTAGSDPGAIETPTAVSSLSWAWNALGFITGFAAFTVAGVPIIFSLIAWAVDAVWIFLLVLVVRGN